jgi:hypothetical protein
MSWHPVARVSRAGALAYQLHPTVRHHREAARHGADLERRQRAFASRHRALTQRSRATWRRGRWRNDSRRGWSRHRFAFAAQSGHKKRAPRRVGTRGSSYKATGDVTGIGLARQWSLDGHTGNRPSVSTVVVRSIWSQAVCLLPPEGTRRLALSMCPTREAFSPAVALRLTPGCAGG